MALTPADRSLLERCLAKDAQAWEEFVDRFLGLVVHTINQTATLRHVTLTRQDVEDLSADVLATLLVNDFAVLRRFRGESSLATYLAVIARRVVVRDLLSKRLAPPAESLPADGAANAATTNGDGEHEAVTRDQVEGLLKSLEGNEADVVRLFYLEGMSYEEISAKTGVAVNTVGPTLSRARARLRRTAAAGDAAQV